MDGPLSLFFPFQQSCESYDDSFIYNTTLLDSPVFDMVEGQASSTTLTGVCPKEISPKLDQFDESSSYDSAISSASSPDSSWSPAASEEEEKEEEEEEEEIDEENDVEYTPSRHRKHRSKKPYDRPEPKSKSRSSKDKDEEGEQKGSEILCKVGKKIMADFRNSQDTSAHHQRILHDAELLALKRIRDIGIKTCSGILKKKKRLGDYLARMRGCLRNAAVGLFLITYIKDHSLPMTEDLLHFVLSCAPPPSTRPAGKQILKKLCKIQAQLDIQTVPKTNVELMELEKRYWMPHVRPEDLNYIYEQSRKGDKVWKGTWLHLFTSD